MISLMTLTACGTQLSKTERERNDSLLNENSGVSVELNGLLPKPDQTGFPVGEAIKVKFTGPVNAGAVEDFMLYVRNDAGQVYSTVREWNYAQDEVTITRRINGQRIGWDMGVTHTVVVEPYITDMYGEPVGPYEYDFQTESVSQQGSGNFKVTEVRPTTELIKYTDYLYVKFSEPVYPGVPTCDSSYFAANFQFWILNTRNEQGAAGIPSLPTPEMCLLCSTAGVCDTLRIRPTNYWPRTYSLVNFLLVKINPLNNQPGLGLRSATNQSHRLQSGYSIFKAIPTGGF